MSDKNIEAKHLLRCSGYSLASYSSVVLPLLDQREHFIRSIINGQSKEKFGNIFHLIADRFLSNKCQPPMLSISPDC